MNEFTFWICAGLFMTLWFKACEYGCREDYYGKDLTVEIIYTNSERDTLNIYVEVINEKYTGVYIRGDGDCLYADKPYDNRLIGCGVRNFTVLSVEDKGFIEKR